ncbi:hypothetical protein ACHAPS_008320 [Verticillium nonalfalfae]
MTSQPEQKVKSLLTPLDAKADTAVTAAAPRLPRTDDPIFKPREPPQHARKKESTLGQPQVFVDKVSIWANLAQMGTSTPGPDKPFAIVG